MSLWSEWQASRERRRRVEGYVGRMLREPDPAVVSALEAVASPEMVRRELRFGLLALGLLVAERDALDDQTAADVNHHLQPELAAEARRDPLVGRLWPERWRSYTAALARRGSAEAPAARLARVLLEGLGVPDPAPTLLTTVTSFVQENRTALNEALRALFGAASLPEDVRPSALRD